MSYIPHELVAAIGDFLAPKWRCRLFICCREWYNKCYDTINFICHRQFRKIMSEIRDIKYDIVEVSKNECISYTLGPKKCALGWYCLYDEYELNNNIGIYVQIYNKYYGCYYAKSYDGEFYVIAKHVLNEFDRRLEMYNRHKNINA